MSHSALLDAARAWPHSPQLASTDPIDRDSEGIQKKRRPEQVRAAFGDKTLPVSNDQGVGTVEIVWRIRLAIL